MYIGPTPPPRRVYRLALYGVASSGKTCILTALAMPRNANPRRLTCCWIEEIPGHPIPAGDPSGWETTDPYHLGWRWLSEQRERLARGELPPPNPNREEPTRFLFDFTAPERGTIRVELIDYSGELITLTSSELAARLRSHMETCDGILLLAEAPHPGRDLTPLSRDLENVKAAFSLLLSERDGAPEQDWPVALLLNKWDRRGPIAFANPDRESGRADSFLDGEPEPPHRALVHTIENAVTPENLKLFPVSAFGAHLVLSDGREVPANDGSPVLRSFGLEDPFLWVAGRRDEIDVETYEQAAKTASWLRFWQLFVGRPALGLASRGESLRHWIRGVSPLRALVDGFPLKSRLPASSELARRVIAARRSSALKLASQALLSLGLVASLLTATEAFFDGVRYRSVVSTRQKPDATQQQLISGEDWLETYYQAPSFRHLLSGLFILDRKAALIELERSRVQRDERSWAPVSEAEGETQLALVEEHKKKIGSNCRHRSEVDRIQAENVARRNRRENREFLDTLARDVNAIGPPQAPTEDAVRQILDRLRRLPHPGSMDDDGLSQRSHIESVLYERLGQAKQRESSLRLAEFQGKFYRLLSDGKVREAAALLAEGRPEFPQATDLEKDFATSAVASIEERCRGYTKSRLWAQAREAVSVPLNDQSVVKLLGAVQIRKLNALRNDVDSSEDRDLYDQILRFRPQCRDQVTQYLRSASTGRMKKPVETYQAYLNQMDGKLDLKLELSQLEWGNAWDGWEHDVRVTVDGKTAIEGHATAKRYARTGKVGEPVAVLKNPKDSIRVRVTLVRRGSYNPLKWSSVEVGSGEYTGTVRDLNGKTIELPASDHTNKASFVVDGIPLEPTLPAWGIL